MKSWIAKGNPLRRGDRTGDFQNVCQPLPNSTDNEVLWMSKFWREHRSFAPTNANKFTFRSCKFFPVRHSTYNDLTERSNILYGAEYN